MTHLIMICLLFTAAACASGTENETTSTDPKNAATSAHSPDARTDDGSARRRP
jgi:hypothetical protein